MKLGYNVKVSATSDAWRNFNFPLTEPVQVGIQFHLSLSGETWGGT